VDQPLARTKNTPDKSTNCPSNHRTHKPTLRQHLIPSPSTTTPSSTSSRHHHDSHPSSSPIAIRRWRKHPLQAIKEWPTIKKQLQQTKYDAIIDAQGLIKSAWLTKKAQGPIHGYDKQSAREPLTSHWYQHHHNVPKNQHAIERTRELLAKSLNYPKPTTPPQNNLKLPKQTEPPTTQKPYIVLLHGTTWKTKKWPTQNWKTLANKITETDYEIHCPWGNKQEHQQAQTICHNNPKAHCLPKMTLTQIAHTLKNAKAVISVDSGLSHLTAALETPQLTLYGPTDPNRIGTIGKNQHHITSHFPCTPCLQKKCQYTGQEIPSPACMHKLTPELIFTNLPVPKQIQ